MPPRRSHTKSRKGCLTCKKRRVKCDENGPPCNNCRRREIGCSYPSPGSPDSGAHSPPKSHTPTATTVQETPITRSENAQLNLHDNQQHDDLRSSSRTTLPSTRMKELELMHRWCVNTSSVLTAGLTHQLQNFAVREALEHEYLMDSILALAALHIASEMNEPSAAAPYVSAALQYQGNALPPFRAALNNITPSNCDVIFLCSIFMMMSAIVGPLIPIGHNDPAKSPSESLLRFLDFGKGIGFVVETAGPWLRNGPFADVWQLNPETELLSDGEPLCPQIKKLHSLNESIHGSDASKFAHYQLAIKRIDKCFLTDIENDITTLKWLTLSICELESDLRDSKAIALLLFTYWGVVLDSSGDIWWTKYSGKRLVEDLSSTLTGRGLGTEWDMAISWARAQVGIQGDVDSS